MNKSGKTNTSGVETCDVTEGEKCWWDLCLVQVLQWDHVAWLGPRLTKVTMRRRVSPTTSMVVRFNLFTTVDAGDLAFVVAWWFWGGSMC